MPATPTPTPETKAFWDATARDKLLLERCRIDGTFFLYPRKVPRCPRCGSDQIESHEAEGTGSLYSYVINARAVPGIIEAPVVIGLVELDEGVRITAQLRNVVPEPDQIPLDMRLTARFDHVGDYSLPYFVPDDAQ